MIKKTLLHFIAILGLISLASAETPWELIKETPETKIFTRENPGDRIKELKVITRMDATIDELVSVYMDGENHPKWYPACIGAKIVKKISDNEFQLYHHIDNPWPVEDRDYVLDVKMTKDEATGETLIEYKDVKEPFSGDKDCVRMKKIQGYWKFAPGGDGKTLVTYDLNFDPGGNTPASFINMSLSHIGTTTFDAMSKYAKSRRTASAQ